MGEQFVTAILRCTVLIRVSESDGQTDAFTIAIREGFTLICCYANAL